MRWILMLLLVMAGGLVAYVRLAPVDVAAVTRLPDPRGPGDYPAEGGFTAVRPIAAAPETVLERAREIALATPRTQLLAGSPADGMMTFETRSKVMGFPDYTTVAVTDDLLTIDARLRFGRADMGVNRARVESWLAALAPVLATP